MTISTVYPKSSIASSGSRVSRSTQINLNRAWAVILSGGDGLPRRPGVPADLRGQRPRHFSRTADSDYIINQTREHVSRAVAPERTMFTVSEDHLRYFQDVADDVPSASIIVEPQDDGTTFAILYSLLRIKQKDPNATVAFFPPDLSVPDPKTFMARVQDAVDAVERRAILILLGVEPAGPDADRQWIEPGRSLPIHENLDVWRVVGFRNASSRSEARELIKRGALWNSSVIVGKISTFLAKLRRSTPEIHAAFMQAESTIGRPGESLMMRSIYFGNYIESDFGRDVLMNGAGGLAVIPVAGVKVKGVARTVNAAAGGPVPRAPNPSGAAVAAAA